MAFDEIVNIESNTNDLESLLESLSLSLMMDNIKAQIRYENSSTTDFLSTVINKFNYILDEFEDVEDIDKVELKESMIDFCETIIAEISKVNDLMVDVNSDIQFNEIIDVTLTLYNFFVLHRYSYVEEFLKGFIGRHKTDLITLLCLEENKGKDITYHSNKKRNIDNDNILILSSIFSIITYIKDEMQITNDEFISIVDNGDYWTTKLKEYITDGVIYASDFAHTLLENVLSEDYDNGEVQRIRNAVRIHFYNTTNKDDSVETVINTTAEE